MKHFKLFEAFAPKNDQDQFKKRKMQVYDIINPPRGWEKYCVVELFDPEEKAMRFTLMDIKDSDFGKVPDFDAWHMNTASIVTINNHIFLARIADKGLSSDAREWMNEACGEFDEWEEIVKDAAINGVLTDNDYKLLQVDKDTYKTAANSKKFGLNK